MFKMFRFCNEISLIEMEPTGLHFQILKNQYLNFNLPSLNYTLLKSKKCLKYAFKMGQSGPFFVYFLQYNNTYIV